MTQQNRGVNSDVSNAEKTPENTRAIESLCLNPRRPD